MNPLVVATLGFAFGGALLFGLSLGREPGALLFLLPWALSRWYSAGRGNGSHWLVTGLVALAVGVAVWLGVVRAGTDAPANPTLLIDGTAQQKEEFTLHPGNVWVVPGNHRNFELDATVWPVDESALEFRLRAPDANVAAGIACLVGEDPRIKTSFVRETEFEFTPIGRDSNAVRTAKPSWNVRIRVSGDRYEAFVDGVEFASASDSTFHAGRILILAARGEVRVEKIELTPLPEPDQEPSVGAASRAAFAVLLLLILIAASARLLRLPLAAAVDAVAFGAVPACVAILMVASDGVPALVSNALTWSSAVLLGVLPWVRGTRGRGTRPHALGAVLVPMLAAFLLFVPPRSSPRASASTRTTDLCEWSGTRLEEGLLYFTHPHFRARNDYLVKHLFGDTSTRPEPYRDRLRLLALHCGSRDWLIDVEETCRDRGLGVEVLDAGFASATAASLKRLLRDVYLEFRPAVVMLNLEGGFVRDAREMDVEAYLARITEEHHRRTLVDRCFDGGEPPRPVADQLIDALSDMRDLAASRDAKFFVLTDTAPSHLAQSARDAGSEARFPVFLRVKTMVDAIEELARPTVKNDDQ